MFERIKRIFRKKQQAPVVRDIRPRAVNPYRGSMGCREEFRTPPPNGATFSVAPSDNFIPNPYTDLDSGRVVPIAMPDVPIWQGFGGGESGGGGASDSGTPSDSSSTSSSDSSSSCDSSSSSSDCSSSSGDSGSCD